MKAAVCHEFGKPLVIEDVILDPPQKGEIQVRMVACAVCHSDIHRVRGDFGGNLPMIAGHEAAGIVEEIGEGVTLVRPGDRVIVSLLRSCGRCFYCQTGQPHLCEFDFPLATQNRLHTQRGQPIEQGIKVAGFAERVVVDQSQAVPMPEDMPLDRACLLACGVITGLGAVVNTARVRPGESVVVIGTGGVGLNSIQGAALAGAYPIIAMDLLESKLEAARAFGATHTINAAQEEAPDQVVRRLTSGRGADYVFVAVGSTAAASQGLNMIRRGGTEVLVGIPPAGATISVEVRGMVNNERKILGSSMGSTRLSVDVPRLVALYKQGRLKLDELITARYSLEQINEAMEAVERGEALRNVIVF